jgi:HKD family nuclease
MGCESKMAELELILQAATDATHADALRALLKRITPNSVLISVAFVREAGVEAVEEALKAVAAKTKFFVGIRNDITTIQGVKRLLALGMKVYAVDTGSRDVIFHPKMYLAIEKQRAGLIIGSANLTFQGLHNNIEASALVTLDMNAKEDRRFVDGAERLFVALVQEHPDHVFEIRGEKEAEALFESGRLCDERIVPSLPAVNRLHVGDRDTLHRMKLKRVARPRLMAAVRKPAAKAGVQPQKTTAGLPTVSPTKSPMSAAAPPQEDFYLVWESKPLQERDLNIPKGANTHITGSMSLDKGLLVGVDHRHFFYDEVFQDLKWIPKKKQPHLRIAQANFEIIIKGINYGEHWLTLSHNTNTQSKSYKQNNAMTNLRWEPIKHLVRNRDLMGRTMFLYRKDTKTPQFLIEID